MVATHRPRQAVLVFDACTLNPFKKIRSTKSRLKAKYRKQLQDQPYLLKILADLEQGNGFTITQFIPIVLTPWAHANDEQVLAKLEEIAMENPQQIVIFVTRDFGFCQESGWRPEQSRVYICILPRFFFSKSLGQYTRLDMMYIIAIDLTNFFTKGAVTYSRLLSPTFAATAN